MKKKKLLFDRRKKEYVLKGRTARYMVKSNKIPCTDVHLCNILNGKTPCSTSLALVILGCISPEATLKDFFIEV